LGATVGGFERMASGFKRQIAGHDLVCRKVARADAGALHNPFI